MAVSVDASSVAREPASATAAERAVADQLPIGASPEAARAAVDRVPLWFHTFSLDAGQIYTPGVARDHRYRLPFLPDDLTGRSVLDVGTFDGFYAFLAEARGARRVVAVDNEQYMDWVRARWGVDLEGGEGFRTIAELLDSEVEYRRIDAFALDALGERFDLILCFGILHRVVEPPGSALGASPATRAGGGGHSGDVRGRQSESEHRRGDPRLRAGRGLRPRRLRLLGVQRREPRPARPPRWVRRRDGARCAGDRRSPAHRLPAGRRAAGTVDMPPVGAVYANVTRRRRPGNKPAAPGQCHLGRGCGGPRSNCPPARSARTPALARPRLRQATARCGTAAPNDDASSRRAGALPFDAIDISQQVTTVEPLVFTALACSRRDRQRLNTGACALVE